MKKRYTIYFHKTLSGSVEVAANSLEDATRAAENAYNNFELAIKYNDVDEEGIDQVQGDEGQDHPEWADYEVNEDGELVEVE